MFLYWVLVCSSLGSFLTRINGDQELKDSLSTDYAACGKGKDEERSWPWQGEVYRKDSKESHLCEAVIITENFMLSPADAFSETDVLSASRLRVVFKRFASGAYSAFHEHRIASIMRHESFQRETRMNNIALIEMRTPIQFSRLLRPVCFHSQNFAWNYTYDTAGNSEELIGPIKTADMCKLSEETVTSFCYEVTSGFTGAVSDLLYHSVNDTWYLQGISYNVTVESHSSENSNDIHFVSYLNIALYEDWINDNTVLRSNNLLVANSCSNSAQFDWVVHVDKYGHDILCYASLIAPSFALVTASCVNGVPESSISVYNQTVIDYYEDPKYNVLSPVKSIHIHPSYEEAHMPNNIAIVELEHPVNVIPVCLPKSSAIPAESNLHSVRLTYWPSVFESLKFRTTSIGACIEQWQEGVSSDGSHICGNLVIPDKTRYRCGMDVSAIPLFYTTSDGGSIFLRGLLDFANSDHCSAEITPDVYLDVMHYADWIDGIVAGSQAGSEEFPEEDNAERLWNVVR